MLVVGETRDAEHAAEMVRCLKERYTHLSFTGHGGALGIDLDLEESDDDDFTEADSGIGNSLGVPGERSLSRTRRF